MTEESFEMYNFVMNPKIDENFIKMKFSRYT